MKRFTSALAVLLSISLLQGRQVPQSSCGTHYDKWREEVHLHRTSERSAAKRLKKSATAGVLEGREGVAALRSDAGNIAVLDDSDGVVARRNEFNLNKRTLKFVPQDSAARRYKFELAEDTYDTAAAQQGTLVGGIGDDDSRLVNLPFAFPFFGQSYREVFVNSDGNLTFGIGDAAVTDRSLGRFTSGAPRLAGLFRDLDPTRARATGGIKLTAQANRFVITWDGVPEYRELGTGPLQTFQLRLYPSGVAEFVYFECQTPDAIAGITPGKLQGATSMVNFVSAQSGEYTSTVAERFSGSDEVDIFSAAQKFYLNHEDAYDYLVLYNALGVQADEGAVAFEVTVRNSREGYGDEKVDLGFESGSKRRLQAILNMGPLSQYPADPNGRVPGRLTTGDTPLTTLAHEAGHLFLAYASVRDPNDTDARPMLGTQLAHWNFRFNSDASLMEGNRIVDNGAAASPRFQTTATVEGFSALDQYLMGFAPPEQVPDTFLVTNVRGSGASGAPRVGVAFDGDRRDIRMTEILQAEGRRTPDHTVAQRRFRFAFVLITASGSEPTQEQLAQLDTYRQQFEAFFAKASSGNAQAETSLKKAVRLSTWPAAGVSEGQAASGSVILENPTPTPLTILLRTRSGAVQVPSSVTIPAGGTQAAFSFRGVRVGQDDLIAEPAESGYETVQSRVNVSASSDLRLAIISGDLQSARAGVALAQPVRIRVTDINQLPYPGIPVQITLNGGGSADQSNAVTDENGIVSVRWTPGNGLVNELRAAIPSGAAIIATALGRPTLVPAGVVNAASFVLGITPGAIATMFGTNLSGDVLINGRSAQIFYSSPRQINFLVPGDLNTGRAEVVVRGSAGVSDAAVVPVSAISPGIFFDTASGFGAILTAGTGQVTQQRPVAAGEVIEIYTTGLGLLQNGQTATLPEVRIGGVPAQVEYSGLAPGFAGLYQVNARIPSGVISGTQTMLLSIAGLSANEVKIQVR